MWYIRLQALVRTNARGVYLLVGVGIGWWVSVPLWLATLVACFFWPWLWPISSAPLAVGPLTAFVITALKD